MESLESLLKKIRACEICRVSLPFEPRPVIQLHASSRILIIGQAPGIRVHKSGIPFDDASGNRLRNWLAISRQDFYDSKKVAIVPMGFCYPGKGFSGDLPPRLECAEAWQEKLFAYLSRIELTLVIGQYAQSYHLSKSCRTVTENVMSWKQYWPKIIPLPHPSPRNNHWFKRNPWFDSELLPQLKKRVAELL